MNFNVYYFINDGRHPPGFYPGTQADPMVNSVTHWYLIRSTAVTCPAGPFERTQKKQAGRAIDQFVEEIRKEVRDCQFGDLKADLMLHVLNRGVDDERMRRRN